MLETWQTYNDLTCSAVPFSEEEKITISKDGQDLVVVGSHGSGDVGYLLLLKVPILYLLSIIYYPFSIPFFWSFAGYTPCMNSAIKADPLFTTLCLCPKRDFRCRNRSCKRHWLSSF